MNLCVKLACQTILTLLFSILGGCTIIHVEGASRTTIIRPGVLEISHAPGAKLVVYRTQGFGLVPGRSGLVLGWSNEKAVIAYDMEQCQIVILDPPNKIAALTLLKKIMEDHPNICLAEK